MKERFVVWVVSRWERTSIYSFWHPWWDGLAFYLRFGSFRQALHQWAWWEWSYWFHLWVNKRKGSAVELVYSCPEMFFCWFQGVTHDWYYKKATERHA